MNNHKDPETHFTDINHSSEHDDSRSASRRNSSEHSHFIHNDTQQTAIDEHMSPIRLDQDETPRQELQSLDDLEEQHEPLEQSSEMAKPVEDPMKHFRPFEDIPKGFKLDEESSQQSKSLDEPSNKLQSDETPVENYQAFGVPPEEIKSTKEPLVQLKPVVEPQQEAEQVKKQKPPTGIPKLNNNKKSLAPIVPKDDQLLSGNQNSSGKPIPVIPSIDRRNIQGLLVRFFRNGDVYHPGVIMAVNEIELKSWEAFLNFLNQQSKLVLSTGAIQCIYTLNGEQIRSMNQLQNRQTYVVASGAFTKTNYRHVDDAFNDDSHSRANRRSTIPNGTKQITVPTQRSSPKNGEQFYIHPYSSIDKYETMILNRNANTKFDQWLDEEVTSLLHRYTGTEKIKHLFAMTKSTFIEIRSFSHLFNMIQLTNRFVACKDTELQHAKRHLSAIVSNGFATSNPAPKTLTKTSDKPNPKQNEKLSISWIYGYDGSKDDIKAMHTTSDHEVLYVIHTVCVLYDMNLKQQRFYTKHSHPITCIATHPFQPLVASSESIPSKDHFSVLIHIWNHTTLETVSQLRKETFGSEISLLSFSPKVDDNLLLVVSRDKPKAVLVTNWKRNEIIFTIANKSDRILATCFAFNTNQWIACVSQKHLRFYDMDWNSKPLKIAAEHDSELNEIYTGATLCDTYNQKLIVGDRHGSIHVWYLMDNKPKLLIVKENVVENYVHTIVSVDQESFLIANEHDQLELWHVRSNTLKSLSLSSAYGPIQSISSIQHGLVIGTRFNYIVYINFADKSVNVITRGHAGSLMCMCSNISMDYFFSVGTDRYLHKWNRQTKLMEWSIKCSQLVSCAALHPERNIIVLGTETNKLIIYDTLSSCYVTTIPLTQNTAVKSLQFSPDGGELAVGLKDGLICLFEVLGNGDFNLRTDRSYQNKNLAICDIFWSVDKNYLLTAYSDRTYTIWSMPSFDAVSNKNMDNITWYQMTNLISCNLVDKSIVDANACAIAFSPKLTLCAGKDGQIRLIQNSNKRAIQTLPLSFGRIESMIRLTNNNKYLLSINNSPTIVEIQVTNEK